jgi:HAD superfamily hydrolase (TIGR01509 family)
MITHVLVDVHGVLTQGDEGQKFSLFLKNNFNVNSEEQTHFWRSYVDKLDKNQITSKEYIKLFNQKFKVLFTPNKYYNLIVKHITPNTELLKYLSDISDKYKIIIVSDNLFDLANKLEKVLKNDFDKYPKFYSYKYGLTKKDGLLSVVIKNLNITPQNCLFIDDNQTNIDVGSQLGINSVLFKNNQQLFTQIEKFLS